MLERLLTGVRTVVRREGRTESSPRSASTVPGGEAGRTDTGRAATGMADTDGGDTDGGTGRFYVCEGCDTTFISEGMAECSKCGAAVRAERRDALKRDSFV